MTEDEMLAQAQIYLDRMYVARSDPRQKEMGLAYIEAERQDLARAMAKFAKHVCAMTRAQEKTP